MQKWDQVPLLVYSIKLESMFVRHSDGLIKKCKTKYWHVRSLDKLSNEVVQQGRLFCCHVLQLRVTIRYITYRFVINS